MTIFNCDNCGRDYTTPTGDLAFVVQGNKNKYTLVPWAFPGGKDEDNPIADLCVDCMVYLMGKV